MNFQDDRNPYAPPTGGAPVFDVGSEGDEVQVLADRGTRWFARFIDGLLSLITVGPVMIALFATDTLTMRSMQKDAGMFGLYVMVSALPVTLYQWVLLSKTGQTLGKKWMNIRVVKTNGAPIDFVSGVILREWIVTGMGFIPFIGSFVGLVDALMIFGSEKRCLHDLFAGTKVITATKFG